jgi:hypothetical protein
LIPVVFLVALLIRIIAVEVMLTSPARLLPDAQLYDAYARELAASGRFALADDGCRRTPGYPIFLAACRWLIGRESERFELHAQGVLSAAVAAMVAWLAATLFGEPWWFGMSVAGLVAGGAWAFDLTAIALVGMRLSETLFTFLFTASMLLLVRGLVVAARPAPGWKATNVLRTPASNDSADAGLTSITAAAVGALFAAATLVRPSCLLLMPIGLIGALAWFGWDSRRLFPATAALLGFVLVMSPWWVRNAARYGRPVPTTLNVGESLFDGVRLDADGGSDMRFAEDPTIRALPELERDRHWFDESRRLILADPVRVLGLAVPKLLRFWSPWPNHADFRRPLTVIAGAALTIPVYALALVGLATLLFERRFAIALTLAGPVLYFALLHAVFVSSVRYRVAVMPGPDVLAGIGAAALIGRWASAKRTASGVAGPNGEG